MTAAPGVPEPAIEDEGESEGEDFTTHDPAGGPDGPDGVTDSLQLRLKRAWRVVRGKDLRYLRVEDPAAVLENKRKRQANWFRGIYAPTLISLMCVQLAFADYFFWQYAQHVKWQLDRSVVVAFLSSVVVEVIGAVTVVTRALFNERQPPGPS